MSERLKVILIAIGLVICFVIVFFYNKKETDNRRAFFLEREIKGEVDRVVYEGKTNKVYLNNHDKPVGFTVNLKITGMEKYYSRKWSEFIFPGDSVLKKSGEAYITIVPKEGNEFNLYSKLYKEN